MCFSCYMRSLGLYILSMPTRMKDLAEDLGVSVVTISKVLRNHPDIGKETRERVLKRVKELRYQPNAMARSLVTGRSYLIGLVVPDLIHPFFAEVAKALSMAIQKKGYSLIIASSEENPVVEEREIEQMLARRLDGLIVASSGSSKEPFRRLQEANQPFVLIRPEVRTIFSKFCWHRRRSSRPACHRTPYRCRMQTDCPHPRTQ